MAMFSRTLRPAEPGRTSSGAWILLIAAAVAGACDFTIPLPAPGTSDDPLIQTATPTDDPTASADQAYDDPADNQVLSSTTSLPVGHSKSRPTDLAIVQHGLELVELSWTDNSYDETGFLIERYTDTSGWVEHGTAGPEVISYFDTNVQAGNGYCYRVVAFNNTARSSASSMQCTRITSNSGFPGGDSASSSGATGDPTVPPDGKPGDLTVSATAAGIELDWTDNSSNEQGFSVLRYTAAAGWVNHATISADTTRFIDIDLQPEVGYCYRVAAFNAAGNSVFTTIKCASASTISACTDGIRNGTETDIDCGGDSCASCGVGSGCASASDCIGGFCIDGICQEKPVWNGPRIVPWVECNLDEEATVGPVVEGLNAWKAITDTAIVSSGANFEDVYVTIKRRVGNMRIIPGHKTSYYLINNGGFDSVAGWSKIAVSVQKMLDNCDEKVIIFENETAMKSYIDGASTINLEQLRKGLQKLPAGVEYLWYPSAAGSGDLLQRYLAVNRVVDDVLDVRFVDHASLWGPSQVDGRSTLNAVHALEAVASEPTLPLIYSIGRAPWWTDAEVPRAVDYVGAKWGRQSWAILYPGNVHWIDGARSISQILLQDAANASAAGQ